MSLPRASFVAAFLAAVFSVAPAAATIVERVVAVVGEQPILLSEVRTRIKPFEAQIGGAGAEGAAQRSQLFSQMLERMVDEELLRRAASQVKVTVTQEEVDAAIERVARGNKVSPEELMLEIERSGVNRSQYRREIRGQLLDAKVMNVRLQGRVSISPDDVKAEYNQLVLDERRVLPVHLAVIRMEAPSTLSASENQRVASLAAELAQRARKGESFEQLSSQYSSDPQDRAARGLLPEITPNQMPPELANQVINLDAGEITDPVLSDGAWIILKVIERAPSSLPSYADAEPQLMQRVQMRKMEKARRRWLDDMRKRTHVEVRL